MLARAFLEYGVKLILFGAVAGLGIASGIQLRKRKNAKSTDKE